MQSIAWRHALIRAHYSPFARFSLFFAMMKFAIGSPFFTVYTLYDLEYSHLLFMLNTTASVLTQFLTSNFGGCISDSWGNRWTLAATFMLCMPVLREMRTVPPLSVSGWISPVTRDYALAGLIFDIVSPRHPGSCSRSDKT